MFFLFKLLLFPLWLPFKILIEIAEHSRRHRHYSHRRRAPAPRRVRTVQPRTFTPAQAARPVGTSSGRSTFRRGKAVAIMAGSLLLLLFFVVGIAAGSPGSHKSPGRRTPTAKVASVPGSSMATHRGRHHHRKHYHRQHRHQGIKHHAPATTAPTASPPAPAGCYPLSNEGTCYEPGEFCRDSDHGATGLAGDGERIMCEDNDGWRWESA